MRDASNLGALELPVDAGAAQEQLTDPVVEALADFLGWSLRDRLNAKLANLTGTSSTAVAAANVFTFDPFEPRATKIKRPLPSLYVWWSGQSTPWRPVQLQRGRIRTINVLYVFDELPGPDQMALRSGLFAAVDGVFCDAADRGGDPGYSYNSKPNGTLLEDSIGDYATWDWSYLGGQGVQRLGIDDANTRPTGLHPSGRDFPAFAAQFEIRELLTSGDTPVPLNDSTFTIEHDGLEVLDHTLEFSDGSDAE